MFLDVVASGKGNQTAKGTQMHAFTEDCATLISILLQHSYAPEDLAKRLTVGGVARRALLVASRLAKGGLE